MVAALEVADFACEPIVDASSGRSGGRSSRSGRSGRSGQSGHSDDLSPYARIERACAPSKARF